MLLRIRIVPNHIRNRRPLFCKGLCFGDQVIHTLRCEHFGGVRAGALNGLLDLFRVVKHRAGAEVVFIPRLALVIFHKQGGLQSLNQGAILDVNIGIVNKRTRLHITVCIDVQIVAATRDTALHIFSVVPEIKREERLLFACLTD